MRRLFVKIMAVLVITVSAAAQVNAQESFAYQAVIRDSEGTLVTEKEVGLQFSLMNEGKAYYVETQKTATNQYGNISVEIGKGVQVGDSKFTDVPWHTLDITLKVEVDVNGGTNYILLGETKISPAPYALYASSSNSAPSAGSSAKDNGNLFEVTDREGNVVFAVTPDGIVVYVDEQEGNKARRSGFRVTGRTATKDQPATEYFAVTAEGTQVYVDPDSYQNDKARRSGFRVTGRTATKESDNDNNYMSIDADGTHIYVDDSDTDSHGDKARRSGFRVTGRTATKDNESTIFSVDGSLTTVYVDDPDQNDKARRSGFRVTGRTATKGNTDYVAVTSESVNLNTTAFTVTERNEALGTVQSMIAVNTNSNGQVQVMVNTDIAIEGETIPVVDADEKGKFEITVTDSVWLIVSSENTQPTEFSTFMAEYPDFTQLMVIYGEGEYAPAEPDEDMAIPVSCILFDSDGRITRDAKNAAAVVFSPSDAGELDIIIRAFKPFNHTIEFGLMNTDSRDGEFVKIVADVNSKDGLPFNIPQGKYYGDNGELLGEVTVTGDICFGSSVTIAGQPSSGNIFAGWQMTGMSTGSIAPFPINLIDEMMWGGSLEPIFAAPVLYVSDQNSKDDYTGLNVSKPLPSITYAVAKIFAYGKFYPNLEWTIKVNGTVSSSETAPNLIGDNGYDGVTIPASKILLTGCNGLDDNNQPKDIVNGTTITIDDMDGEEVENKTTALTINTAVPVTIENLTITGGGNVNYGGGVKILKGNVTLGSHAVVTRNEAGEHGGGVFISEGLLTIGNGAEISHNKALWAAGGVCVESGENNAKVILDGGLITENEVKNDASVSEGPAGGGGVLVYGENSQFEMNSGAISKNKAQLYGAGVNVNYASFTMKNGTIGGESINDGNKVSGIWNYDVYGAGVYLQNGTFTMEDGSIKYNSCEAQNAGSYGGGVYINSTSVFDMQGGTLSSNFAEGTGSGVFIKDYNSNYGTFKMSGKAVVVPYYYDEENTLRENDVYLPYGAKIIVGEFDASAPDTVALITPGTYHDDWDIKVLDGNLSTSVCDKFAVAYNSDENNYWKVNSDGNLCQVCRVLFVDGNQLIKQQLVEIGSKITGAPTFDSREGYGFLGWKRQLSIFDLNPTFESFDIDEYTITNDDVQIVLFTNWQPYYKIIFNSKGGDKTFDEQDVLAGTKVSEPNTEGFTKEGYTFAGWYYLVTSKGYVIKTEKFDFNEPLPEVDMSQLIMPGDGQLIPGDGQSGESQPTINLYANWVASNLYVSTVNGDDSRAGISTSTALKTIKAAIDTIKYWNVADMDYTITVAGMSSEYVTIDGGSDSQWPVNANSITLKNYNTSKGGIAGKKDYNNTLLTVKTAAKVILDGFTIEPTNELGVYGGTGSNYKKGMVLYVGPDADVTLKGNTVLNGELVGDLSNKNYKGAAYVEQGTLTMSDNAIIKNFGVKYGGGVYVAGDSETSKGTFVMNGNAKIENCKADMGGGLDVENYGKATISDYAAITGNTARSGAGLYVLGEATINDYVTISQNSGAGCGAGVYVNGGGKFTMNNGTISGNIAKAEGQYDSALGCGVYVSTRGMSQTESYIGEFVMNGGTITNNTATEATTRVYGYGVFVGATYYSNNSTHPFFDCMFKIKGNVAIEDDVTLQMVQEGSNSTTYQSAKITLAGDLNTTVPITITPYYTQTNQHKSGLQVLATESGVDMQNTKFAVTDQVVKQTTGNDVITTTFYWKVNDEGKLALRPMVTFKESATASTDFAKLPVDINGYPTFPTTNPTSTTKVFKGWRDGNGNPFTAESVVNEDITVYADFVDPIIGVKQLGGDDTEGDGFNSPVGSLAKAVEVINGNNASDLQWTIKIDGTLTEPQSIGDVIASKLTIEGKNEPEAGAEPSDAINGGNVERQVAMLTVNTATTVVIKNLKITGGNNPYNAGVENSGNGGGLYVGKSVKVTLADGALIAGNKAYNGGGAYFDSQSIVFMYGSATIGDKNTTEAPTETNCSNFATYGGGVYTAGNFYLGCSNYVMSGQTNPVYTYIDVNGAGGIFRNYATTQGGGIYVGCAMVGDTRVVGTIANNRVANDGYGGAVYVHGYFTIGDYAYIPAGADGLNDVCLSYGGGWYYNILIDNGVNLQSTTPIAQITPVRDGDSYVNDVVFSGTYFNYLDNTEAISKFTVTPIVSGSTIQYYKINNDKKPVADGEVSFTSMTLPEAEAGTSITAQIIGSNFSEELVDHLKAECKQGETIVNGFDIQFMAVSGSTTVINTIIYVPSTAGTYTINIMAYGKTVLTTTLTVTE